MTESSKKNETENKADPEKNVKFEFSVMENGGKNSYVVTVSWCNRRLADDVVRASMVTYCVKELGGQLSENSVSVLSDETIEKIRLIGTRADADALASALMVKAPTADTSRGTVKIFNDLVTKVGEKVKTNGECDHEKIFDTYVKKASDSVKETARKILDTISWPGAYRPAPEGWSALFKKNVSAFSEGARSTEMLKAIENENLTAQVRMVKTIRILHNSAVQDVSYRD
jgi:hypothetical protein